MTGGSLWTTLPLGLLLCASQAAAQGPLATQDPASAQPTLPKPLSNFSVPGSDGAMTRSPRHRTTSRSTSHHRRYAHARYRGGPVERPELANVELLEPLPHPPQPPHVTVPVPAYLPENFVTYFTAPPPPVVCRPTRYDRFAPPDVRLVDETPVLCTADNP